VKLYSFPISPNGKRVNVCAAEAGVALDPAMLDIAKGELRSPEYMASALPEGEFGLADILLGCTLELGPLVKLDLGPYPAVRAWIDRLQARDSWRASMA